MRNTLITFYLLFGMVLFTNASPGIDKSINYGESKQILELKISENYMITRILDNTTQVVSAVLLDIEGNELYRKSREAWERIIFAEVVESQNIFIVVFSGHEAYGDTPEKLDQIVAYDLKTGALKWTSHSNGGLYGISPDQQYMIPREPTEIADRAVKLEIINLSDGSKITPNLRGANIPAAWLDNERIIIVVSEYSKNSDFEKSDYYEKKQKLINNNKEKIKNNHYLKKGKITEEEYQQINNKIEAENQNLIADLKTYGRVKNGKLLKAKPKHMIESALKLVIYNFKTNNIEQEKVLVSTSNEKILGKGAYGLKNGFFHKDNENIFIFGRYKVENGQMGVFLKLDKDLNIKEEAKLNDFNIINIFYTEESMYFRIRQKNSPKSSFISSRTAKILSEEDLISEQPQLQNFDFSKNLYRNHYIYTNKKIELQGNSIVIKEKEK